MKIDIDDATFNMLCGMKAEDLKSFFLVLQKGTLANAVDSDELSFKDLKKSLPKQTKKVSDAIDSYINENERKNNLSKSLNLDVVDTDTTSNS